MIAWLMVPAGGPAESSAPATAEKVKAGDVLIDGGNSYFKDATRRAKMFREKGIGGHPEPVIEKQTA